MIRRYQCQIGRKLRGSATSRVSTKGRPIRRKRTKYPVLTKPSVGALVKTRRTRTDVACTGSFSPAWKPSTRSKKGTRRKLWRNWIRNTIYPYRTVTTAKRKTWAICSTAKDDIFDARLSGGKAISRAAKDLWHFRRKRETIKVVGVICRLYPYFKRGLRLGFLGSNYTRSIGFRKPMKSGKLSTTNRHQISLWLDGWHVFFQPQVRVRVNKLEILTGVSPSVSNAYGIYRLLVTFFI